MQIAFQSPRKYARLALVPKAELTDAIARYDQRYEIAYKDACRLIGDYSKASVYLTPGMAESMARMLAKLSVEGAK